MRPIFLIGFMGCGKSTLGRALSKQTGIELIDLDHYIERRFHRSITDIFAIEGETRFRDLERRMLEETGEFENVVIACGGGTPCFGNNMEFMNSHGTTVYLEASEERLLDRLIKGRRKRPLLAGLSDDEILLTIRTRLAERAPWYEQAQFTFNSDKLENVEEIAFTVQRFIEAIGLENIPKP